MQQLLSFLSELEKNNYKAWFDEHKPQLTIHQETIKRLVEGIEKEMEKFDVLEKTKIFRIYRDVRFSKDKTPYKNNMSVGFTRAGAHRRGGYYLHIEPGGNSFIGGGFWAPEPHDIKRIRDDYAMFPESIQSITTDKQFIKYFGQMEGESLVKAPKGYDANHPNIELIKKKQFLLMKKLTDSDLLDPNLAQTVGQTFNAMMPFFDYMSEVLTTNINGESILD